MNKAVAGSIAILTIGAFVACGDDSASSNDEKDGSTNENPDSGVTSGDDAGPSREDAASPGKRGRVERVEEVRQSLEPVATAVCEWLFNCCEDGEIAIDIGASLKSAEDCATFILGREERGIWTYLQHFPYPELLRPLDLLGYGFDYGTVKIDEEGVSECAEYLKKRKCISKPKDHCETQDPPDPSPCNPRMIYAGTRTEGEDCLVGAGGIDCAAGLVCLNASSPYGVCIPEATEGTPCTSDSECGSNLRCSAADGRCVEGIAKGAACKFTNPDHPFPGTEAEPCAPGLACDTQTLECADAACLGGGYCSQDRECPKDFFCVASRCGPLAEDGQECFENDDCLSARCEYDPMFGMQVCAGIRAAGEICDYDEQCESGFCRYDGAGAACQATVEVGEACPSADSRECHHGLCNYDAVGETFVCVAGGLEGDSCTSSAECVEHEGLRCTGDECQPYPFANGLPCQGNNECQSQACVDEVCSSGRKAGEKCGADLPPCRDGLYCAKKEASDATGKCEDKKRQGESCGKHEECWGSCDPVAGSLRCRGSAPSDAICSGRAD